MGYTSHLFKYLKKAAAKNKDPLKTGESFTTLWNEEARRQEHDKLKMEQGFPEEQDPNAMRYQRYVELETDEQGVVQHPKPPWIVNEASEMVAELNDEDAPTYSKSEKAANRAGKFTASVTKTLIKSEGQNYGGAISPERYAIMEKAEDSQFKPRLTRKPGGDLHVRPGEAERKSGVGIPTLSEGPHPSRETRQLMEDAPIGTRQQANQRRLEQKAPRQMRDVEEMEKGIGDIAGKLKDKIIGKPKQREAPQTMDAQLAQARQYQSQLDSLAKPTKDMEKADELTGDRTRSDVDEIIARRQIGGESDRRARQEGIRRSVEGRPPPRPAGSRTGKRGVSGPPRSVGSSGPPSTAGGNFEEQFPGRMADLPQKSSAQRPLSEAEQWKKKFPEKREGPQGVPMDTGPNVPNTGKPGTSIMGKLTKSLIKLYKAGMQKDTGDTDPSLIPVQSARLKRQQGKAFNTRFIDTKSPDVSTSAAGEVDRKQFNLTPAARGGMSPQQSRQMDVRASNMEKGGEETPSKTIERIIDGEKVTVSNPAYEAYRANVEGNLPGSGGTGTPTGMRQTRRSGKGGQQTPIQDMVMRKYIKTLLKATSQRDDTTVSSEALRAQEEQEMEERGMGDVTEESSQRYADVDTQLSREGVDVEPTEDIMQEPPGGRGALRQPEGGPDSLYEHMEETPGRTPKIENILPALVAGGAKKLATSALVGGGGDDNALGLSEKAGGYGTPGHARTVTRDAKTKPTSGMKRKYGNMGALGFPQMNSPSKSKSKGKRKK